MVKRIKHIHNLIKNLKLNYIIIMRLGVMVRFKVRYSEFQVRAL
jgi:hypothetical protein